MIAIIVATVIIHSCQSIKQPINQSINQSQQSALPVPSCEHASKRSSSTGCHTTECTELSPMATLATAWRDSKSITLMLPPERYPAAIFLPHCEKESDKTALLPTLLATSAPAPFDKFHTRTVLSHDPLASIFASVGLNASDVTDDVASKLKSMEPVSLFQILMVVSYEENRPVSVSSQEPVAKQSPSADQATA